MLLLAFGLLFCGRGVAGHGGEGRRRLRNVSLNAWGRRSARGDAAQQQRDGGSAPRVPRSRPAVALRAARTAERTTNWKGILMDIPGT